MGERNNLRSRIESFFHENPGKSFGVSEIARKFNAKRNTIHYHLKILKAAGFICQNNEGEYYSIGQQEDFSEVREGIIECRYHPRVVNIDWCPSCGNPICENCLTTLHDGSIACQECKKKEIDRSKKAILGINQVIMLSLLLFVIYEPELFFKIIVTIIFTFYFYKNASWLNSISKNRKEYNLWRRTTKERMISEDDIQSLILDKKIKPCKFHDNKLGINRCEKCNINICNTCSKVIRKFLSGR